MRLQKSTKWRQENRADTRFRIYRLFTAKSVEVTLLHCVMQTWNIAIRHSVCKSPRFRPIEEQSWKYMPQ